MPVRIFLGIAIVIVGFLLFANTMSNNQIDLSKPVDINHIANGFIMIIGEAVAIALGAVIAGWGFRSRPSHH